jgi:excisionase family DNA binding protein
VPSEFTIDALAGLLGVSRRTIERAIEAETLIPASYTASGRARFSKSQVEELKSRADAARVAGYKYVIGAVLAPGAVRAPWHKRKAPPLTAKQWYDKTMWKRRNVARYKPLSGQAP